MGWREMVLGTPRAHAGGGRKEVKGLSQNPTKQAGTCLEVAEHPEVGGPGQALRMVLGYEVSLKRCSDVPGLAWGH